MDFEIKEEEKIKERPENHRDPNINLLSSKGDHKTINHPLD